MKRIGAFLALLMVIVFSAGVFAAEEVSISVDRLNYWDSESHTFTVANAGNDSVQVVYSIPAGWAWSSGSGCTNTAGVTCNVPASGSSAFTLTSPAGDAEYLKTVFSPTSFNNSYTEANNVTTVRINPDEIFHTLVEFGRGRGNYFYDSGFERSGSGKSRPGCTYLPNGTMFELNFLHKVHNIQQYLGLPSAEGEDASFSCVYTPDVSVVRKHLITSIDMSGGQWSIDYLLPEISSSWERMGYVGMDYDETDVPVGTQIISNCTGLDYSLPGAYGNVQVDYTDLVFDVIDKAAFSISASTSEVIGNGTQEVEITYQITNNAPTGFDNVIIEIDAPQYSSFIGTRGELWGSAQDSYRLEKLEVAAGATETITLVARFDTSSIGSITSVPLSKGAKVSFVPCWEINAYNPAEYIQYLTVTDNGTVDMNSNTSVTDIIERINFIYNVVIDINTTTNNIENTVNLINLTVGDINTTVGLIWDLTFNMNITLGNMYIDIGLIYNNTEILINQFDCNGSDDTPICGYVQDINNTVTNLNTTINTINNSITDINSTIYSMNESMTEYFSEINNTLSNLSVDFSNVTNRLDDLSDLLQNLINCSQLPGSDSMICQYLRQINDTTTVIEGTVTIINGTVSDVNNTVTEIKSDVEIINTTMTEFFDYMNNTVWGNLTAQDLINDLETIIDLVSNSTIDTEELLVEMSRTREFQEEMVFLITDSIVNQREAKNALVDGDVGEATAKLSQANNRLKEVTNMILEREESIREAGATGDAAAVPSINMKKAGYGWMIPLFLIVGVLVLGFYLFSRPKNRYDY